MFEKLLSSLPYNPSLVQQLSFYSKRMRRESIVRRTGIIFLVLAFFVQFFAFISPPQPTIAYSSNDMINGGITSRAEAVSACQSDTKSYGTVLKDFGISCTAVAAAATVSISSKDHNNTLYSMGWLPQGQTNHRTHKATNEVGPLNLVGISAPNTLYGRLLSSFDSYDHSTYKALQVTNTAGKTFFILFDCGNLVAIGQPTPVTPCKYDTTLLSTDAKCYQPCTYNKAIPATSSQCFEACPISGKQTLPKSSPQCVAACPYNKALPANSPKCFSPCTYNKTIPATSAECFPPCEYNQAIPSTNAECKPCDKSVSSVDALACIERHKTATNVTQKLADANNSKANAGDVITYTLTTKNNGKADIKNVMIFENLSDVLDYATVTDPHDGVVNANGAISWPAMTIKAGETVTKQITVTVKSPLPVTPVGATDGAHFDSFMTNVYGDTVTIEIPQPPVKVLETVTTTALPNTGPGTSLATFAAIIIVASYFFARSRLLANEALIAVQDNNSGGF
ncbi:MAG: hypothetical protein QFB87_00015 [Patescibacteria group bacterium]|nr:hypothetical protein [Patescibacteria group bacterium]